MTNSASVLANVAELLPDLEAVYKDVHSHPELSMQETRTAGIAADRLRAAVGGIDPDMYARAKKEGKLGAIPTNHNPRFAPVIHPTLETGVEAMVVAAQAWLSR